MPPDFTEKPFLRLDTPLGPVNVHMEKLREID